MRKGSEKSKVKVIKVVSKDKVKTLKHKRLYFQVSTNCCDCSNALVV